jgi:hypothetical protein
VRKIEKQAVQRGRFRDELDMARAGPAKLCSVWVIRPIASSNCTRSSGRVTGAMPWMKPVDKSTIRCESMACRSAALMKSR